MAKTMAEYTPQIGVVPAGWLSKKEVAERLGLTNPDTVRAIARGQGFTVGYVGHALYIREESVEKYLADRGARQGGRRKKKEETDNGH